MQLNTSECQRSMGDMILQKEFTNFLSSEVLYSIYYHIYIFIVYLSITFSLEILKNHDLKTIVCLN